MGTDLALLETLGTALAAAGAGGLLAVLFRQPLILGYVIAGLAIGPNTPGLVADTIAVDELANIGIVLLMFAIGVQVTFRELLAVGRVAIVGAVVQVTLLIVVGYAAARLLGWDPLPALALGFVVSNSSSTVMSKVLSEFGEENSTHARIGLNWSSIQDFTSVAMIVFLLGAGNGNGGTELGLEVVRSLGVAALFIALLVPVGMLLPRALERLASMGNREMFLLAVASVALLVAWVAQFFGVSPALAAFVAGILVARSDLAHHVLGEITPLRDIFSAVFFVAVGMLVDPRLIVEQWELLVVVLLLICVFKGVLSAGITLAFGYRGRTAVLTGVALAQSAEFSFLIAQAGTESGILTEDAFGLLLLGTALSILIVPFVYRAAMPVGGWVEERLSNDEDLATLPPDQRIRNHAIVLGYGRVGHVIEHALRQTGMPYVIVDQDQNRVRAARANGALALAGSASNVAVLDAAGIDRASLLTIAVPDPISARRIVEHARRANPDLDIVVRTHSQDERRFLETRGVNEAVVGELELAIEMSRHALAVFGMKADEIEHILTGARAHGVQGL